MNKVFPLMISCVLSVSVTGLNCCSPDNDRGTGSKNSPSSPLQSVHTPTDTQPSHQSQPAGETGSVLKASFRTALARRVGKEAEFAGNEFQKLLEIWHPVGRTAASLKQTLGSPDREDPQSMTYHFDTGWVAWEYVFAIESGKVTKVDFID